ncbi:hypothetical protein WT41_01670 [Burkholderia territorii]|uniref:hypothetical protein n=1 Tax=Burkholderia territorii TaxID=1503055 RepID=UPI000756EE21|nr:hypothetical protein [Burkholderia territorii]KWA35784.1 hypothetical protein WT41_01670 [Burkholderia territorii]
MSGVMNTIRQLTGRLALLRSERERYQALCAAAYQLAGAVNAPVRFLDAFADAANGEIEARQKTDDLLPVDPAEAGAFPAWSDTEMGKWKRNSERLEYLCREGAYVEKTGYGWYVVKRHNGEDDFESLSAVCETAQDAIDDAMERK